jgi:hypothetical protein
MKAWQLSQRLPAVWTYAVACAALPPRAGRRTTSLRQAPRAARSPV